MSVNISTSSGYPTNTGGTVRVAAAGAVVDDIFVYLDGSTKWERVVDGPYSVRWAKIFGDGTNYLSKANAVLAHSDVRELLFDLRGGGSITLTGTLECGGKVLTFAPDTKITGSVTINNAIINAPYKYQIFASTNVTLTNCKIATEKFSTCWYTGPASGADQVTQFQKAADTCILNNIKNMYTPGFTTQYVISKGVLLRKDSNGDGNLEFFTLSWEGERRCYGNPGDTVISLTATDSFAIGWQKVKGLRIANMSLQGPNTNIQNLGSTRKWCEDPSFDWINGCRNNAASPCAGLAGDIGNSSVPAPDRYPGFTSFYTDPSSGGSSDVIIEGMDIRWFVVGIGLNMAGLPQNGDLQRIRDCWVQYCYSGIAVGESQNRSIFCDNIWCWGGVETLFDARRYGDGTNNPPECDGVNIAGGVRYLCRLTGFGNSHGMSVKRMHAELLTALGGSFENDNGDLFISDTWIQFTGAAQLDGDGTVTHHPKTMYRGRRLLVSGNSILTYYSGSFGAMAFAASDIVFDTVLFDTYPINNFDGGQTTYRNCKIIGDSFNFGEGQRIDFIDPAVYCNQRPPFITDMSVVTNLTTRDTFASVTRKKVNRTRGLSGRGWKDAQLIYIGSSTVASIQNPDPIAGYSSCTITLSTSSDEYKMLQVGDVIVTTSTDEFSRAAVLHTFGTVAAKNGGTGVVTFRDFPRDLSGAVTYDFFIYRMHKLIPAVAFGTTTSGSPNMTNIKIERSATSLPAGVGINSPYFPEGTWLVSYDGAGNAVLSNNANASATNVEILSSDWQGIVYGSQPDPAQPDKIGWKRGDQIYNNRPDIFNTVVKWKCTKTGISNESGAKPQFVAVEWYNDEFTSSTTTSRTVENYFTFNFKVSVASDLTDFKIGTTVGGEEVLSAQPIFSADGWTNITVNYFDGASTTLYFTWTGTVATSIKIIKVDPVAIT